MITKQLLPSLLTLTLAACGQAQGIPAISAKVLASKGLSKYTVLQNYSMQSRVTFPGAVHLDTTLVTAAPCLVVPPEMITIVQNAGQQGFAELSIGQVVCTYMNTGSAYHLQYCTDGYGVGAEIEVIAGTNIKLSVLDNTVSQDTLLDATLSVLE